MDGRVIGAWRRKLVCVCFLLVVSESIDVVSARLSKLLCPTLMCENMSAQHVSPPNSSEVCEVVPIQIDHYCHLASTQSPKNSHARALLNQTVHIEWWPFYLLKNRGKEIGTHRMRSDTGGGGIMFA